MAQSSIRRTVLYAVIGGALLLFVVLQSGILILFGESLAVEGNVVSVIAKESGQRDAVVRLNLGPTVSARVAAACLVYPGQVATVTFKGPLIGPEPAFFLWESRDKL